jgi:hypothetical protein
MPWHYHWQCKKRREEKRKEQKMQFWFFSDEKTKIGCLQVTEWFEMILKY